MKPTCKAVGPMGFYCGNTLPCPYHVRIDPGPCPVCGRPSGGHITGCTGNNFDREHVRREPVSTHGGLGHDETG
jgi:hypothetical protein